MTKSARDATKATRATVTGRGLLGCAIVALGASLGCGRHLSEVASVIDDGGVDAETPCGPTMAPCPANQRCAGSCDDPTTGKCELIPDSSTCTGPYSAVCGCNGISYFNDCLRKAAQEDLKATGQCTLATTCDGGAPCLGAKFCSPTGSCGDEDAGQYCAFTFPFPLFPGPLPAAEEGAVCGFLGLVPPVCWALPKNCPMGDEATITKCGSEGIGLVTPCAALKYGGASFVGSVQN
jgi:hypothetical protein